MKRIISIVFVLVMLLTTVSICALAEDHEDGYANDYKDFYCNCDTRPFMLELQKLENQEYTREEITLWAEHMLAHSRNKGKISIPVVFGEEQGIAQGDILRAIVGERGTVECSISTAKDTAWYSYCITVSEEIIAEVYIDVLAAGIYCGCGTYHLAPKPLLCGDLDMNNEIQVKDYMKLKRIVLDTYTADETELLLADVNADGEIDAQDYMMVKRHVLGTYEITDTIDLWLN